MKTAIIQNTKTNMMSFHACVLCTVESNSVDYSNEAHLIQV